MLSRLPSPAGMIPLCLLAYLPSFHCVPPPANKQEDRPGAAAIPLCLLAYLPSFHLLHLPLPTSRRTGPEPLLTLAGYRRSRGRITFGLLLDRCQQRQQAAAPPPQQIAGQQGAAQQQAQAAMPHAAARQPEQAVIPHAAAQQEAQAGMPHVAARQPERAAVPQAGEQRQTQQQAKLQAVPLCEEAPPRLPAAAERAVVWLAVGMRVSPVL